MSRLLFIGLLSCSFAVPTLAALPEGTAAPDFEAQASLAGKAFSYRLSDALKKGTTVVYFYPSAYTGGCNIQAHTFSENSDKFAKAGASIIGVSMDSIGRLNEFSADPQYCAGKIAVASDADGKIAKSYDLTVKEKMTGIKDSRGADIDHGFTERTTFVVTPNGKIASIISGQTPAANVEKTLEAVQKLSVAK